MKATPTQATCSQCNRRVLCVKTRDYGWICLHCAETTASKPRTNAMTEEFTHEERIVHALERIASALENIADLNEFEMGLAEEDLEGLEDEDDEEETTTEPLIQDENHRG